jgi:hypothetical protein
LAKETAFRDATTAAELWQLLESDAGLQSSDYDEPMVRELRKKLGLIGRGSTQDELTARNVTIEQFVAAFFDAARPYVKMWSDLLVLFERAAATAGETNLRVEYRFDENALALDFDLDHFRRAIETAERVMARFDLSTSDLPHHLWAVLNALGDEARHDPPAGVVEVDRFHQTTMDRSAPWPAALPPRRESANPRLDGLLAEAWSVAGIVLDGLRSISHNYESLKTLPWDDEASTGASGASRRDLRQVQSDFWLPTLIVALTRAANPPIASEEIADNLDAALAPLRNTDPERSESRRRLAEFLQLPIWKHRYELYSNWVCTQIVMALKDCAPRVHADHGEIKFSFSGTHLATFDGFTPRLHIWTELRMPLTDPVGKGRENAIQPDITLLADPITARRSPLAVECKQYRRPSNKKFADAITDYGRGHADAQIVLVDYGPARSDTVLKYVASEVRPRATVIGDLHPSAPDQIAAFQAAVRTAVGLRDGTAPRSTAAYPGCITLRWGAEPTDLDLHVQLDFTSHDPTQVYYQQKGALDEHPFCALDVDCTDGHGPETVTIARWLPATYTIVVRHYSGDGSLATSDASVTLDIDGEATQFLCPSDLKGKEWTVCVIDGKTGRFQQADHSQT